jgi:beta-aspartyl-peptidase (threonine type)
MPTVARRSFLVSGTAGSAALLIDRLARQSTGQDPAARAPGKARPRFAIALHGGAGSSGERRTKEESKEVEKSLGKALDVGVAVLQDGGTSLDAVERVIRTLEDDPRFNAGRGAVFNAAGGHELDASIMRGDTLACGAVAAVRTVKNPIALARMVMEKTRHVLLTGDGAERFADEMRVERVENAWFDTDKARREWERIKSEARLHFHTGEAHLGTVGCVALDAHGNLAAGTSTGGLTNKRFGRVGDSPIIGAGTYADNATCAVSCTGIGEQFIRQAVAHDLSARLRYRQQPLKDAVHEVLHQTLQKGDGGIIALSGDGTIVMDYSTVGMARAAADSSGRREVTL